MKHLTLKILHNLTRLSQNNPLEACQDFRDAATVDGVEVFVGEGDEHVIVDGFAVDELNRKVGEKGLFKCFHFVDKSRP